MMNPSADLEHQPVAARTPWRRRLMQMMGISAVSAVVMVAGCTGRVGDETVETLSMESSTTTTEASPSTTAAASNTSRANTAIGDAESVAADRNGSTSGLQGLTSSGDAADAWTSTSLVAPTPVGKSPTTTSTTVVTTSTTSTIAPTTTTEATTTTTEADAIADPDDETTSSSIVVASDESTTTTTAAPAPAAPLAANWSGPATVAHVVVDTIGVYRQPGSQTGPSGADWTFASKTQFGSPTTFLILGSAGDWYEVLLPVRQKHTRGWVHSSQIQTTTHNYHATVSVSSRRVVVYDNGVPVKDTGVVVGKSSTPTPIGRFYVTDKLRHANPGGAYGPWILALSARSEALTTFNGGEPIVALHGTNKPWLVGGGHSNGCIRMPNDVITKLAEFVPLGTPVDIVA